MEKSQAEFVQECLAEVESLKERISALEAKLQAFQADEPKAVVPDLEDAPVDFTDIDMNEQEVAEGAEDVSFSADNIADAMEGAEDVSFSAKNIADATKETSSAPVHITDAARGAGEGFSSAKIIADATEKPSSVPMKEADGTAGLHWRTDKPGLRVKNIRSGISLYDRALFIGTLFKEDFSLYDKTIADLNNMVSMDQAVDYIRNKFPDWNLKSDVVYNFMMSVRKKLG